jgi:hypothetical protein
LTVPEYLDALAPDRRAVIGAVRSVVRKHLPKGYQEAVGMGMILYIVPLSRFPNTYNGHALIIAALASQKNSCTLHLMGVYGDPRLKAALTDGFHRAGKKLDLGKACVRFKTADDLALDTIAEVVAAVPPETLIAQHEAVHAGKRRSKR